MLPHGEPVWVDMSEGEFTMYADGGAHRVGLPAYSISKVPIANA